MDKQRLAPHSGQSISRLQTVDQHGYSNSHNLAGMIAWLIAGFNIGIILIVLLALVILPILSPDFIIKRKKESQKNELSSVMIVTQTPSPTLTFPPPTLPVDDDKVTIIEPTIEISLTPTPTETLQNSSSTQLVITLQSPITVSEPTSIPPTHTPQPPPASHQVTGIRFSKQGWNNCGPANLTMGLSFFGWQGTQTEVAAYLKPEREDRNVNPQQMVDYVNNFTDLRAIWRMGGTIDQVLWLISNDFIVIVESGYDPNTGEGWYGHYETVVGYDDSRELITVYDSYLGTSAKPSVVRSYNAFDRDWQAFNRNYIVIYPVHREIELSTFLGADWSEQNNRSRAAEVARREASEDPDNGFAWFNLGTSLAALGRYEDAVVAYQQATSLELPWRMMWYQFGMYEALLQTGRLADVLTLVTATLATKGGEYIEEAYYYRGRVFEIQSSYAAAIEQYNRALALNPNYNHAQAALRRVGG